MSKKSIRLSRKAGIAWFASLCLALLALFAYSGGEQVSADADATIAQGFKTRQEVGRGGLVSIVPNSDRTVEIATQAHPERLIGIVTDNPLVAISGGETEVQVVTNGLAHALVSDINGEVKRGDHIVVSAIEGVGGKAVVGSRVIGVAHGDFSEAQQVKEHQLTDTTGVKRTVKIGLLLVNVSPTYYEPPTNENSLVPGFLQHFANSIAGRQVVPLRIFISVVIFLAGIVAIGVLFYSSVRYSITAIGRNPLSATAVHKGLVEVAMIGGMILLVTLITVYLILVI